MAGAASSGVCHVCADRAQVRPEAGGQVAWRQALPLRAACLPEVLWPLWSGGGTSAASSPSPELGCTEPALLSRISPAGVLQDRGQGGQVTVEQVEVFHTVS